MADAFAHAFRADAARLPIRTASVDCIVTSPPYNAGMPYAGVEDRHPAGHYERLVRGWSQEMARVLKVGGRAWVNVPPAIACGKGERLAVAEIWHQALGSAGLRFRDWVVWEQTGCDQPTAWGSYLSPNAPNLRGRSELILLFFKGSWSRGRVERNDISARDWPELTRNIWRMPCAARDSHPAPFPAELPRRAILLSTWPGDLVCDPFSGSGTTLRVARDLGRDAIGADLSEVYAQLSRQAVAQGVLL
jgi:site-specific DNA-methyltransferase (adenine-specific)